MNSFSIYLIKSEFSKREDILDFDKYIKAQNPIEFMGSVEGVGEIYYVQTESNIPEWLSFLCDALPEEQANIGKKIYTAIAKVVLVVKICTDDKNERMFAISWGYGKYLLNDSVVERDFGIKVVLNSLEKNRVRSLESKSFIGPKKTSREQLFINGTIDDFGLNIGKDLVNGITGKCNDEIFMNKDVKGTDLLQFKSDISIQEMPEMLKKVYEKYTDEAYLEEYEWIDFIKVVKDKDVIYDLDSLLVNKFGDYSSTMIATFPEIIEWENVIHIKYTGLGKNVKEDIDIAFMREACKKGGELDDLKNKKIEVKYINDIESLKFRFYNCLYLEVEYKQLQYCFSDGEWYEISNDYFSQIENEYNKIKISEIFFPIHEDGEREDDYNNRFVQLNSTNSLCMDKKTINYGQGHSSIELCDILTRNKEYIHIKKGQTSSGLSHLFNQGLVSSELIKDAEFIKRANNKIAEQINDTEYLINVEDNPKIIYGIITTKTVKRPEIPFFSKIVLVGVEKNLRSRNYDVYIKNISSNRLYQEKLV